LNELVVSGTKTGPKVVSKFIQESDGYEYNCDDGCGPNYNQNDFWSYLCRPGGDHYRPAQEHGGEAAAVAVKL
jgi:hypothetical protein